LPLIEAAYFGIPILTADVSYSREVIGEYECVKLLKYNDENEWAKGIIDHFIDSIDIILIYLDLILQ